MPCWMEVNHNIIHNTKQRQASGPLALTSFHACTVQAGQLANASLGTHIFVNSHQFFWKAMANIVLYNSNPSTRLQYWSKAFSRSVYKQTVEMWY